jgi:hypothetical protein
LAGAAATCGSRTGLATTVTPFAPEALFDQVAAEDLGRRIP